MIKKIKLMILSVVGFATLATPMLVPALAQAQSILPTADVDNGLCQGANLKVTSTPQSCEVGGQAAADEVNSIIALVINIFSLIVGVASVIMIIVGGMRYIVSGGDSGNVTSAKNTIMYAIIGLVVVALAQFIVKFVLGRVNFGQ